MGAELTLGVEEELHLIDLQSWQLSARAPQVLSRLDQTWYSAELQRTTVETNTAVVRTLTELREELLRLRKGLVEAAARDGLGVAAVGTAPRSTFSDFELTATGRYGRMQEQYRLLVDEQLICGTQIHVGVSDRDLAVEIMQRVAPTLPVLLALSASSPFWNGQNTGYASIRTTIWQRWPSAGTTGELSSAARYDQLLDDLIASGVIADRKMAYFDVRPSSHAPTLELRVCDACPLVDDAVLIAGLFRAAVRAAELDVLAGRPRVQQAAPLYRAGIWQAARGGLSGDLLAEGEHPRPVPAPVAVRSLLHRLRPQLEELGDWDEVTDLTEATLARGNSADRQRAAFVEHGQLDDVVRQVVEETHGAAAGESPATPVLRRYRSRAGDEAVGLNAQPRPVYREVIEHVRALGPEGMAITGAARDAWAAQRHLAYVVAGPDGTREQPFEVDLLPRMIHQHEWTQLEHGLVQRARAIECFLRDVYGEQRIVEDGVLDRAAVVGAPGWEDRARRLPAGVVRAPVAGFDLVRNEYGGWRVLEDNVRNPSGVAYGVAARALMDAVVPGMPRPPALLDPATAFERLRSTLLARSRPGTRAVLLSSGPASGAWFEHRKLADGAGLLLAGVDDLDVRDGVVLHRASGDPVGVLYLRLDDELLDLRDRTGRALGEEVFEVAAAGGVVLANAPGNGIADDKAMYRSVPEFIGYYLRERPLLESVPTYRLSDESERRAVLERIGELVTKPVDGYGGAGVLIGPAASAAEVAARRAEIAADPANWVAQEVVDLSSVPSWNRTEATLQPRRVDLRAFVYVTGTGAADCHLADVALTRVAPEGSLVVNSSRGGGAKDTWILVDRGADAREGDTGVRAGR
ncbi:carboxylate--amine ligase/circularly permuted type 2 ATP-grasp protein [Kineococcus rhizosphaerae]|uniref:Putative glutamate--cysteine ligase 2 n=1 Tax=Kineococcus rhizosphaerae TaxID=559628 RepID=A0A2T0R6Q3_9ACTN|nr:carboxylate--amine ligase/circularly permuted type 2 ATP-grasp protein [Kineococcus rhizosphaerae]PRY16791.1 carboxylate-amine ligase [Kineococcus rhizosphaerae]